MRGLQSLFAAAGLAAVAAVATTAGAALAQLEDFRIGAKFPNCYRLEIVAPAELNGAPCEVLFGAEPFTGNVVGARTLSTGLNYLIVANPHQAGWFTASGPFESRIVRDKDIGQN